MQRVDRDTINYHVAVCSAAYFETCWDYLSNILTREQLGELHCIARKKVMADLEAANKRY